MSPEPVVESRGDLVQRLLEQAGNLLLQASDLMKLTDEDGIVYAGPKAHVFGAMADLCWAEASQFEDEKDA